MKKLFQKNRGGGGGRIRPPPRRWRVKSCAISGLDGEVYLALQRSDIPLHFPSTISRANSFISVYINNSVTAHVPPPCGACVLLRHLRRSPSHLIPTRSEIRRPLCIRAHGQSQCHLPRHLASNPADGFTEPRRKRANPTAPTRLDKINWLPAARR